MLSPPPFQRVIDLESVVQRKSCFLFGPRQTGKSFLIKQRFPGARAYNLLELDTFRALSRSPYLLREELYDHDASVGPVVIDEIEKLPELVVSLDPRRRRLRGVDLVPLGEFLSDLWSGAFR